MTGVNPEGADDLVHDAFFYTDASSYRAGLLDFIRTGLANDEPVLVAVPQPGLGLVRTVAGWAIRQKRVDLLNAGRALPAIQLFI